MQIALQISEAFTICPAPTTPSRFTSAAGRAAIELKYLTRLVSRAACRVVIIEAIFAVRFLL